MNDVITKHYYLQGNVQGVGCRDFVVREAKSRGVTGWVRNLNDGRVEVMAKGTPAALNQLEEQLHVGPPLATVVAVESETVAMPTGNYVDFKKIS